jgi:DNA-binding XRE family transcriptional regulator
MKPIKKDAEHTHQSPDTLKSVGAFFVGNNQHEITVHFGYAIKMRRQQLEITQTELAALANLNRSYLSELEHGLTSISLERAERLARALRCSLRDLLK